MENESADNLLIKILDADTVREKLLLIKDNKEKLDARTLGNIAVVFDLVPDTDHPEELFVQIVQYLETRARFETERLR